MTKLAEKHCVPCRGGVPSLQGEELLPYAEQLPDWKIVEEHHIAKGFQFPDFKTALDFVDRIGATAEQEGHHPDLCLSWGKVDVQIYTHKIRGLTESDFVLAAKIDRVTGQVFVSGGTGYIGQRMIRLLIERGHAVTALVRPASTGRVPPGCATVIGEATQAASFAARVSPADTLVHLVGVSHPSPWKEREFRAVDLASVNASVEAAVQAGIKHFVYISVAQPVPVMKAYIQVRAECEALISRSGMNATFVRPWYVLGPGHWWPVALIPFYRLLEKLPGKREAAMCLGLVTIQQMVAALVWAVENPPVENPPSGARIISVPEIRAAAARLPLGPDGGAATPATAAR